MDRLTVTNELHILGKQNIAGYQFTGIEGGFGEGKKAMLVKEIAEIHGQPLKEVNRRINDNRNRFKDGVDIIDFKVGGFKPPSFYNLGYSNQSVANSNNIYLLSERGYAKLLKILEDDTAWELYDQF
ncbi:ORF6N domain-containing protein, partial [Bacillus mycoides]|uniref:ORF6N domain-containing protein n=1 Tax=Bacillus mycoides TaxID=1405 RepID=UPI002E24C8ED|nr:ORF6N domain-containing protein [Bacillus mycoides]